MLWLQFVFGRPFLQYSGARDNCSLVQVKPSLEPFTAWPLLSHSRMCLLSFGLSNARTLRLVSVCPRLLCCAFPRKKLINGSQMSHSFRKNTNMTVAGIHNLFRLLETALEFCADCTMHYEAKVEPINAENVKAITRQLSDIISIEFLLVWGDLLSASVIVTQCTIFKLLRQILSELLPVLEKLS